MTVNEMIRELQNLVEDGYGDSLVRTADLDEITCIDVSEINNDVVVWF